MKKSKILILFCGGTIIMDTNAEGSLVVQKKREAINQILELGSGLKPEVDLSVEYIANVDSTNITPSYWDKITKAIKDNYADYDGFVITHGTDTMAYTSSALSWTLHNLGKPVILTGSQIPGSQLESDASRNFINAVRLAMMNISGVYVLFDHRIIKGDRVSKVLELGLDAFRTINELDIGTIKTEFVFSRDYPVRHEGSLEIFPGFQKNILVLHLVPGMDLVELLEDQLRKGKIQGVVFMGYGPGNIPYEYHPFFALAQQMKISVVVTSQCLEGVTAMRYYDVGKKALDTGIIESNDMSMEAVCTKLMWAIKHYEYEEVKKVMDTCFEGDVKGGL